MADQISLEETHPGSITWDLIGDYAETYNEKEMRDSLRTSVAHALRAKDILKKRKVKRLNRSETSITTVDSIEVGKDAEAHSEMQKRAKERFDEQ